VARFFFVIHGVNGMNNNRVDSWDVITVNSAAPDSLWAGYITASRLAAAGCRHVRLFVESVEELARRVRFINPTFWIQEHNGFEIYDQNLANVVEPATHVVRVFDSPLPGKYLDRLSSGSPMRRLVVLHPFSTGALDTPRDADCESSSLVIQHIQQGELGHGAGFLKDLRAVDALRVKWQANHRCREATLEALGVSHRPAAKITLLVTEALGSSWMDFVRALINLGQPVHLLVGPGPQRAVFKQIVKQYGPLIGAPAQPHGVSITNLPDMLWSQCDEVVWLSDLVVTSSESMASRAIQSGCPLIWSVDMRTPTQSPAFIPAWYTQRIAPECARFVQALCHVYGNGQGGEMSAKLRLYFSRWAEVKALADSVCELVRASADVIDVMIDMPLPENTAPSPSTGFVDTMPTSRILASTTTRYF
jgi:hypothetical protein